MTTPSRRAQIRRQRTRTAKIALLRRRYQAAKSEDERNKIVEKIRVFSSGPTVDEFLAPIRAAAAGAKK